MARSIWKTPEERAAFEEGRDAATAGQARMPRPWHITYNQRAAFNDGWDTKGNPARQQLAIDRTRWPKLPWELDTY